MTTRITLANLCKVTMRRHHWRTAAALVILVLVAAGCSSAMASSVNDAPLSVLVLLPRTSPSNAVDVSALQAGMDAELKAQGGRASGHPVHLVLGDTTGQDLSEYFYSCVSHIAPEYASTSKSVAVIGPFSDECASVVSSFDSAGVAVVSPTVDLPVLTHYVPGSVGACDADSSISFGFEGCEPADFYPTGVRNYAHVTATWDQQGAAAAWQLAQRGVRRVFMLSAASSTGSDSMEAPSLRTEARRLDMRFVGSETVPESPSPETVARSTARIISSGADGVACIGFDAGFGYGNGTGIAPILSALRVHRFSGLFIGAFEDPTPALLELAPKATEGMYYTSVRLPLAAMPPLAQRFAGRLLLSGRRGVDAVYGAVAMQVVLAAIAASNGTRKGVEEALFGLRVNSLLGPMIIDANGDPLPERIAIFQVEHHNFVYRHTVVVGPYS